MAITFTRKYDRAEVLKNQNGLQDIVVSIYCIVTATEEEFTAIAGEVFPLTSPDPNNFIPFDQLSETNIDSWIIPTNQYLELKKKLSNSIFDQQNPKIIIKPLPFNLESIPTEPIPQDPIPTEPIPQDPVP